MKVLLAVVTTLALVSGGFADLNGHWAEKDIMYMVDQGYVSGVSMTEMKPDEVMSRAQGIVMAQRIIEDHKASTNRNWYIEAYEKSLLSGWVPTWTERELMANMSRMEMIRLLYNAQEKVSNEYLLLDIEHFVDADALSKDDYPMVQWAVYNDIIDGKTQNKLALNDSLTRGEGMVLLKRFIQQLKQTESMVDVENHVQGVSYLVENHDDTRSKLTISWGEKPTGGYRIQILDIVFDEQEIVVYYKATAPSPDAIVTQALTYPKDSSLIDKTKLQGRTIKLIHKE